MPHNKLSDELLLLAEVDLDRKDNHYKLKECLYWLSSIADTKYTEINEATNNMEWRVVADSFKINLKNL